MVKNPIRLVRVTPHVEDHAVRPRKALDVRCNVAGRGARQVEVPDTAAKLRDRWLRILPRGRLTSGDRDLDQLAARATRSTMGSPAGRGTDLTECPNPLPLRRSGQERHFGVEGLCCGHAVDRLNHVAV